MIKEVVQIFKSLQQDRFIFEKSSAGDKWDSSSCQNIQQNALFLRNFQLVIIGAVQIFKTLQQNCLIFEKISARDNRGISNFQTTSTKLLYFRENFSL